MTTRTMNESTAEFDEISTLTSTLTTTLRRMDEKQLNRVLEVIPTESLRKIVRRPLPEPVRVRETIDRPTPPKLRALIRDAALLDEPDPAKRMQLFIGFCRYRQYSYNTTLRYIHTLKARGVFGDNPNDITVRPSKLAFADSGKRHERMISIADFVKMFKHLRDNFTKYYAPLLIAMYTGLRTFEILQFSTQTLHQLMSRQEYVSVLRKQTVITVNSESTYWRPVYTTRFTQFVDQLVELYRDEYRLYERHGINVPLFVLTPKTLVNRLRLLYFEITGHAPPHGFGIHSCRNVIATIMANETDNIASIQAFLQHRDIRTTQTYINTDLRFVRREYDRLTRNELREATNNLYVPSERVMGD